MENRPDPLIPTHRTRIVATIGPASSSRETIERLIRAGMSVARLNFSHGDFSAHALMIARIREAEAATGRRVAIMADLPGPKMRIGDIAGERLVLTRGEPFIVTTAPTVADATRVSVTFASLPHVVKKGDPIYLNDGYVQLEVNEVRGQDVHCTVTVGGELRSRKGLNLPGIDLGISAFTERDRECLAFALSHGVDAVSQSFVESAADIDAVREAARALGHAPFVIAKIERARALDRLQEVVRAADGVMIARGDLGVEVPIERIALIQKEIMIAANRLARPVITATQMLESMTTHRLPTRAEATDVANAILDGTDAVMLSGESATGDYPVESVEMLAKIATVVEPARRRMRVADLFPAGELRNHVRSEHLVALGVEACFDYDTPAAVFVPTQSGDSARRIALLRLPVWTVAAAAGEVALRRLQFSCGVLGLRVPEPPASWSAFARDWVRAAGFRGSRVILTSGPSAARPDAHNRLEIIDL